MSDSYPGTRTTPHSQIRGEHEESVGRLNMTVHMIFNLAACFYAGYLYFWEASDGLEGDAQCFAMYRVAFVLNRPFSINMFWLLTVRVGFRNGLWIVSSPRLLPRLPPIFSLTFTPWPTGISSPYPL